MKVLIGGHDRATHDSIRHAAANRRVEVLTAEDSDTVMDIASAVDLDVAFLDVDIPPMGALATWRVLSEREPGHLACVLTMDLVTMETLHEATLKGIYSYLRKPVDDAEVRMVLHRLMRRHDTTGN